MSKEVCEHCDAEFKTRKRKPDKFTGWQCPECARLDFEEWAGMVGAKKTSEGWVMDFREEQNEKD